MKTLVQIQVSIPITDLKLGKNIYEYAQNPLCFHISFYYKLAPNKLQLQYSNKDRERALFEFFISLPALINASFLWR